MSSSGLAFTDRYTSGGSAGKAARAVVKVSSSRSRVRPAMCASWNHAAGLRPSWNRASASTPVIRPVLRATIGCRAMSTARASRTRADALPRGLDGLAGVEVVGDQPSGAAVAGDVTTPVPEGNGRSLQPDRGPVPVPPGQLQVAPPVARPGRGGASSSKTQVEAGPADELLGAVPEQVHDGMVAVGEDVRRRRSPTASRGRWRRRRRGPGRAGPAHDASRGTSRRTRRRPRGRPPPTTARRPRNRSTCLPLASSSFL